MKKDDDFDGVNTKHVEVTCPGLGVVWVHPSCYDFSLLTSLSINGAAKNTELFEKMRNWLTFSHFRWCPVIEVIGDEWENETTTCRLLSTALLMRVAASMSRSLDRLQASPGSIMFLPRSVFKKLLNYFPRSDIPVKGKVFPLFRFNAWVPKDPAIIGGQRQCT